MNSFSVISSPEEFLKLKSQWNELLCGSSGDSIFLTWEWIYSWWESYKAGKNLWIVICQNETELIGIFPLYRKQTKRVRIISYKELFLLGDGSGDSDYLDFIIKEGVEGQVIPAFVNFLLENKKHWDIFNFNEVPQDSLCKKIFQEEVSKKKMKWWEKEVPCIYVELPDIWEEYLSELKPRMRTKIRSLPARLLKQHSFEISCCNKNDNFSILLESLFDLHGRRWSENGEAGVFHSPEKMNFYYKITEKFLFQSWLRFYSLSVDGQYIAHQFCFKYRNNLYLLQEGFAPDFISWGIGNILRAHVFKDCIESKISQYDFLSGMSDHKLSWGGKVKISSRVVLGWSSVKNLLVFEFPRMMEWAKKKVKPWVPKAILDSKRKWNSARKININI